MSSSVAEPGSPDALKGLSAARAWRLYFRKRSVLFLVVPREGPAPLLEATPPLAVVTSMLPGSNPNLPREEVMARTGISMCKSYEFSLSINAMHYTVKRDVCNELLG